MSENEQSGSQPLPFGERAEIDFRCDFGSVTILPVRAGETPCVAALGKDSGDVQFEVRKEGNLVHVRLERPTSFMPWSRHGTSVMPSEFEEVDEIVRAFMPWGRHEGSVILRVPAALTGSVRTSAGRIQAGELGPCELELTSSAGRVEVSNMSGHLKLHSDAGRIEASDLGPGDFEMTSSAGRISVRNARGRLRLSSNAGRIDGERLAGSIDVQSDMGTVRLGITWLDPGEHRVRSRLGSIRVELARGLDARVEGRASLGSVRIQYPSRPNAAAVLNCTADAGSIRVHEGDWAPEPPAPESPSTAPAISLLPTQEPPPAPVTPTPDSPCADADAVPSEAGSAEAAPKDSSTAGTETERILKMVASGEISPQDADELLKALELE